MSGGGLWPASRAEPPPALPPPTTQAERAEAQALADNGASLDPSRHPWMGAGKAIEWVAFRGADEPADIDDGKRALMLAERALVDLAGRGLVRAMGVAGANADPADGTAENIKPEAFRAEDVGLTVAGELGLRLPVPLSRVVGARRYRGPRFHRVEFATADVLREWPEATPSPAVTAPSAGAGARAGRHSVAAEPFIPRGHIALLAAVAELATGHDPEAMAATKPDVVARLEALMANAARTMRPTARAGRTDPVAESEALPTQRVATPDELATFKRQIGEWKALEARQHKALDDAQRRLRQALGDAEVAAEVLDSFGNMLPIPREHWRVDAAVETLRTGKIDWWHIQPGATHHPRICGHVGLLQSTFERWASPPADAPTKPDATATKPLFTAAGCGIWLRGRYAAWPKSARPPTEKECLRVAREQFAGDFSREDFRVIRRAALPEKWRGTGPRGPRN